MNERLVTPPRQTAKIKLDNLRRLSRLDIAIGYMNMAGNVKEKPLDEYLVNNLAFMRQIIRKGIFASYQDLQHLPAKCKSFQRRAAIIIMANRAFFERGVVATHYLPTPKDMDEIEGTVRDLKKFSIGSLP